MTKFASQPYVRLSCSERGGWWVVLCIDVVWLKEVTTNMFQVLPSDPFGCFKWPLQGWIVTSIWGNKGSLGRSWFAVFILEIVRFYCNIWKMWRCYTPWKKTACLRPKRKRKSEKVFQFVTIHFQVQTCWLRFREVKPGKLNGFFRFL